MPLATDQPDSAHQTYASPLADAEAALLLGRRPSEDYGLIGRARSQRLLDAIRSHIEGEAHAVATYRELAESTHDPVIALLLRLVHEDEQRHHGLLQRIGATLEEQLYWTRRTEALPSGAPAPDDDSAAARLAIRECIRDEQEDARQLRAMARDSRRHNGELEALLLDAMALDSQKHERILRFILRRLEHTARRGG